ncbi:exodeoxyribonuclease VII large subunit [Thiovibrio sp. JS02]
MQLNTQERIQTVTELTRSIRGVLEVQFPFVSVVGEISNLRTPFSGHLYFTLKDAAAQLKAVLFKTQQRYLACKPQDGMEVVCRGRISLYEPRGEYQLIVDTMEGKGTGALQLAFERLKEKLASEGLFAPERKRLLPLLPEKISLITSPQGAALHDFLKIAGQRFPSLPLEIVPVRVQGEGALEDILAAIEFCNQGPRSDLIVLCRGGGSLEDLWTFNEERLARAIADSAIPVVSAIGHEVDFTIADFVADFRAPTPSAAAEAIIPNQAQLQAQVRNVSRQLARTMRDRLSSLRHTVQAQRRILGDPTSLLDHFRLATDHASAALQYALSRQIHAHELSLERMRNRLCRQDPSLRLNHQQYRVQELQRQMTGAMQRLLADGENRFARAVGILDAVSPLAVLARGYAIVKKTRGETVVRSAAEVDMGEELSITLHQGEIACTVSGKTPADRPA